MSGRAFITISNIGGEDATITVECASQEDADALAAWVYDAAKRAAPGAEDITLSAGNHLHWTKRVKMSLGKNILRIDNPKV